MSVSNRSEDSQAALDRIQAIIASFERVEERLSHGEPTWFHIKKKSFAMFADRHHNDRIAIWMAAPPMVQETLVADDPKRYFRPPYVGPRGWVGAYLDIESPNWEEISDLLQSAYDVTKR